MLRLLRCYVLEYSRLMAAGASSIRAVTLDFLFDENRKAIKKRLFEKITDQPKGKTLDLRRGISLVCWINSHRHRFYYAKSYKAKGPSSSESVREKRHPEWFHKNFEKEVYKYLV